MVAKKDQTGKGKIRILINATKGRNVLSVQILEVFRLGVGTVPRLKRDAWSIV